MTIAYRSYLLRIWLESNDPPVCRAILESPLNGERHGFANLQALFVFLAQDAERLAEETDPAQHKNAGRDLV
jgi:hypothetical protein